MKGLEANNLCSLGGDMLGYLYHEMTASDREKFELHLADCGTCIDDFAELSQSRYPVYEWKQLAFDPLPTPRIILPAAAETSAASWFDKLRASLAFRPAVAFGGIAAIALVGALSAFVLIGSGGDTEVAQGEPTPTPGRSVVASAKPLETEVVESDPKPSVVTADVSDVKPVKASASKARPAVKPKTATVKRGEPLPTLSTLDDDEDDSLRLADMFEEIGTSE